MKEPLVRHVATMGMALALAFLTWIYLVTQSNGQADIEVEFVPKITAPDLAWIRFTNARENEITAGSWIPIRVSGPKGDVRSLRRRAFKCDLLLEPQDLSAATDTLTVQLDRSNFDLPEKFNIESLPMRLTVHYAKYVVKEDLEIEAGLQHITGEPKAGYQVKSVTASPSKIRARVPADRTVGRVAIQKISVEGRLQDLIVIPDAPLADPAIQPLDRYKVEIVMVPTNARRIPVAVKKASDPEFINRFELEDKSITVELRGPEEVLRNVPESAIFVAAVVTEKDLDTPGPRNITEMFCHLLVDPKIRSQLTVELMPDTQPQNRSIRIKVNPK